MASSRSLLLLASALSTACALVFLGTLGVAPPLPPPFNSGSSAGEASPSWGAADRRSELLEEAQQLRRGARSAWAGAPRLQEGLLADVSRARAGGTDEGRAGP